MLTYETRTITFQYIIKINSKIITTEKKASRLIICVSGADGNYVPVVGYSNGKLGGIQGANCPERHRQDKRIQNVQLCDVEFISLYSYI